MGTKISGMTDGVTANGTDEFEAIRSGAQKRLKISYIWTYIQALTGNMAANARVGVRKNSTGSTYTRRRMNLIEGSNITLTIADDSTDEEVDVTIASSGGGGSSTGLVARYHLTSDQSLSAGFTVFNPTISDYDPGSAVTTGASWHYTVPTVTGTVWYEVKLEYALLIANGSAWQNDKDAEADVYVNAGTMSEVTYMLSDQRTNSADGTAKFLDMGGSVTIGCVTGDQIQVQIANNTGATRKMEADSAIAIYRVT